MYIYLPSNKPQREPTTKPEQIPTLYPFMRMMHTQTCSHLHPQPPHTPSHTHTHMYTFKCPQQTLEGCFCSYLQIEHLHQFNELLRSE